MTVVLLINFQKTRTQIHKKPINDIIHPERQHQRDKLINQSQKCSVISHQQRINFRRYSKNIRYNYSQDQIEIEISISFN
jgi:MarR-like DNA-binding transcriptional regulator SgrR of sgrS sRNA